MKHTEQESAGRDRFGTQGRGGAEPKRWLGRLRHLGASTLAIALSAIGTSNALADGVAEVEACLLSNVPQTTSVQTIEFEQVDRRGSRMNCVATVFERRFGDEALAPEMRKLKLVFEAPPDVRGTEFVLHETDRCTEVWVYRPSDRRVRRLPACGGGGVIPCTDFTASDFARLYRMNAPGKTRRLADARLGERMTYVLSTEPAMTPLEAGGAPDALQFVRLEPASDREYDRIDTWVDRESCVPLLEESYRDGVPVKRLVVDPDSLREQDGIRYAENLRMESVRDRTHTNVHVRESKIGCELAAHIFDEKRMGRKARPRCE